MELQLFAQDVIEQNLGQLSGLPQDGGAPAGLLYPSASGLLYPSASGLLYP